jgi:hypothetical protein
MISFSVMVLPSLAMPALATRFGIPNISFEMR